MKRLKEASEELYRENANRIDKFKKQHCPVNTDPTAYCGDWCPLFGEPRISGNLGRGALLLCQQIAIRFNKITDKRSK